MVEKAVGSGMLLRNLIEMFQERVLLYDGSKGVLLQAKGLQGHEACEAWNITRPEDIRDIYTAYKQAGSDVLQTNTFPGNRVTLTGYGLEDKVYELNAAGVRLAREVAGDTQYVSASIGPTGLMFAPAGDLTFQAAYDIFREQVQAVADADCIHFETFTDIMEMRAAILAARENSSLPIIASFTVNENGRTLSGNTPEACTIICQSLGASMVGVNCSFGPDKLVSIIERMYSVATVPLLVKANAGLPEMINGQVVFRETPEHFASFTEAFILHGVRLIGGCCGTKPDFIRALRKEVDKCVFPEWVKPSSSRIASPFQWNSIDHELLEKVGRVMVEKDGQEMIDRAQMLIQNGANIICLDFQQLNSELDVQDFLGFFSLYVKTPMIIMASDPVILKTILRFYPGRAGCIVDDLSKEVIQDIDGFGALPLYQHQLNYFIEK